METSIWKILLYLVVIILYTKGSAKVLTIGQRIDVKGIFKFLVETLVLSFTIVFITRLFEGYEIFPLTIGMFIPILVGLAGCWLIVRSVINIYKTTATQ